MRQDFFDLAGQGPAGGSYAAPATPSDAVVDAAERGFEDMVCVARLLGRSRGAALRFWSAGRSWTGAALGVSETELTCLDVSARVQARARPAIAFPIKNVRENLYALVVPLALPGGLAAAILLIDDEPKTYNLETTAGLERLAAALAPQVGAGAEQARAARILQAVPDAILSVRADLAIDYRNAAADALFGPLVAEPRVGIDAIFPQDVREASRQRIEESLAILCPGEVETMQFVGLRADGRVFPMELTLSLSPEAEGGAGGRSSIIIRDCAQRFAAESALKAAKNAAEAASRAKTSFLANISHELQTPLNGAIGLLDGLELHALPLRDAETVRLALASARDLQTLVADVLELTRLESDAEPVRAVSFDLAEFCAGLGGEFSDAARRKDLELRLEIAPDAADLRVLGDADKLGRMLSRLLDNAIKFTSKGHVRLAVSRPAPALFRFEVSDSGVGFAADLAPRLFAAFEQAELGLTRRFGGAGLGLALCREIANLLGAEIGCISAPDRGAAFHITVHLDVDAAPVATPVAAVRAEITEPGRPLRVLIADDNDVNLKVLETILATINADVATVENGAQAYDAIRREPFDVVLMDMMMPVMDGLSATQAIRRLEATERRSRLPVVMVSANTLPEHMEAARLAGVDGYLTKPVGARQLLETVGDLLAEIPYEPELAQAV